MPEPFVFLADQGIPDLNIAPGDVVSVTPGDPDPIVVSRVLPPDYRRILREAGAGALRLVEDPRSLRTLAADCGLAPHLHLVEG